MTVLVSAPPIARPVPWQRLAWVAWRRYRVTLIGVAVVLGLLALDLLVSGLQIRSAYDELQRCAPRDSAKCRFLDDQFHNHYGSLGLLGPVILFLPGLVGAFAGAPLIARELESGTFRYAWTQGVGRMRWAAALLIPGAVAVAVAVAAFGALLSWQQAPLNAYGLTDRLEPSTFPTTGLTAAGWTLAGFTLGALAGVLWRRVLPAVATSFIVWFGLAFLVGGVLRQHYLAPLRTTSLEIPRHAMTVDQWWVKGGVRVDQGQINQFLDSYGAQVSNNSVKVHAVPGAVDPIQALLNQGYLQVTAYHPDSRYWTFQWIEFGWLAVLSAALLALTFWLLRRRAA